MCFRTLVVLWLVGCSCDVGGRVEFDVLTNIVSSSAPIFTDRRCRLFTTAARVENKLEKAGPELAEAKRERDEAKSKLIEAERELKKAKGKLDELTEKRERGELVDKDDFARADKAVDRADKAVENARADVQRAHEIYTKLLPVANGACSCVVFAHANSLFFDTLHF